MLESDDLTGNSHIAQWQRLLPTPDETREKGCWHQTQISPTQFSYFNHGAVFASPSKIWLAVTGPVQKFADGHEPFLLIGMIGGVNAFGQDEL